MPPAGVVSIRATGGEIGRESLLRSAGTALFDLLDAPGNITRSGIGYIQTGDTDYLKNIAYNILPGPDARRIPGSEITGSDNYGINLLVEMIDPTLPISGIATATKAGMLTKVAVTSAKRLRMAKAMNRAAKKAKAGDVIDADHLTELVTAFKTEKEAAKAEKAIQLKRFTEKGGKAKDFKLRHRNVVSAELIPFVSKTRFGVETIPFTNIDAEKIHQLAQKVSLMPSTKIAPLLAKAEKLDTKARRAGRDLRLHAPGTKESNRIADKVTKYNIEATHLRNEAAGLHQGVIPAKAATKIRKKLRGLKDKLSTHSDHENLMVLRELTKTQIARNKTNLGADAALLEATIDDLAKTAGETLEQMNIRLTRGGEARGVAPAILSRKAEADLVRGVRKAKQSAKRRVRRANKKGGVSPILRGDIEAKFANKITELKTQALRREMRLDEADEILEGLEASELSLLKQEYNALQAWVKLAKPLGVKIDELQSSHGYLSFVPRIISKEALALKKAGEAGKKKYSLMIRDFTERLSGANRRKLYPESEITEINKIMREDFDVDFDFFNTNMAEQVMARRVEHNAAMLKAVAVQAAVRTNRRTKGGGTNIKHLFKKLGLDPAAAPSGTVPEHVGKFLTGAADLYSAKKQNEFLTGAFKLVDNWTQWWRIPLTVAFPAFHHRNMVWNMIISKANGGSFRKMKEMGILQRRIAARTASPKEHKLWRELTEVGAVSGGEMEDFARVLSKDSKAKEWIDRPLSKLYEAATGKETNTQFDLFFGRAYGKFIEENARGAHYLAMRAKGLNKFEAMREMNKVLFDYSDLTIFEKTRLRPLFTFYTWSRKNIPLMLNTVITNPRLGATYAKITGMGEDELPNWMKGTGFAFKAPESIFGENQALSSLGLGLEDLFILNVSDADPAGNFIAGQHEIQRLADKIASKLSPVVQIPAQLISGRQFFTGRPLEDIPPLRLLEQVSPVSRVGSTARKLFDADKSIQARIVDFMTGARVYPIDIHKVRIDIKKRKLKATDRFRTSEILVPRDKHDKTAKKLLKKLRKEIAKGG